MGYAIALIMPSFLKIQKVASRSSTCRVLKNAKRLNICILENTPMREQTLSWFVSLSVSEIYVCKSCRGC